MLRTAEKVNSVQIPLPILYELAYRHGCKIGKSHHCHCDVQTVLFFFAFCVLRPCTVLHAPRFDNCKGTGSYGVSFPVPYLTLGLNKLLSDFGSVANSTIYSAINGTNNREGNDYELAKEACVIVNSYLLPSRLLSR